MSDQCPSKNDIQLVFKRLRSIPTNKSCFDCDAKNPTWASVTYGVFICIDCSAVHRSLGVHLTFVRSTQLDTNWTWLQLRQMQLGGNANAMTFFRQHNCTSTDAQQKYNSRAAQLYREKLHHLAIQAMRLHGTKLHIDATSESSCGDEKREEDFFAEHTNMESVQYGDLEEEQPRETARRNGSASGAANVNRGEPNVNAILAPEGNEKLQERKSTIGTRKPQAKRSTLGGKKGGLGAQKVNANFAEIEKEATMADQLKLQAAEEAKLNAEKAAEEEEKRMLSMRLAYKDLSLQQKKQEEKLKQVDPKKAEQVERLGMGFTSRMGISHSAVSDMKTIEQENPNINSSTTSNKSVFDKESDGFFDDFVVYGMYKPSSSSESRSLESMFLDGSSSRDRYSNSSRSWQPESRQPSSSFSVVSTDEKPAHRKDPIPAPASTGDEAQKKFGSAKAISSDQFFGDSHDNNWERKVNLSRFEGSSSISSADFFGNGNAASNRPSSFAAQLQTPDLEDVKESVRQGVTKVAGKLSSIANGVMSSIQDRYGY
ncbi:ADP-ribosylation factor GTPase-activating protein 2 isoform X4 [Schistocerca americana]|uniref:ADP-ribosylation factor GTPase-activating protein 2 isoform X4 n=1 Tax=Schistocerca americana TaxID=7009 RepID=UPI001F4F5187|nr:ADP-ribosylation factor GTPase-activating protein 2 isoform X4 [Schistocerca americana]XP_049937884.1 ADP-ribosylation factor GTPase-activating protein 2 isoform X4 [Schistocerca serialis cubense]